MHFEDLLGNNRVFIIPDNLSQNHLARDLIGQQLTQCKEKGSRTEEIRRVALELRKAIQSTGSEEMSWPPKASELNEDAIRIPEDVKLFLVTLLTGSSVISPMIHAKKKINVLSTRLDRTGFLLSLMGDKNRLSTSFFLMLSRR